MVTGALLLALTLPAAAASPVPASPFPSSSPAVSVPPGTWTNTVLPPAPTTAALVSGVARGDAGYVAVAERTCVRRGRQLDRFRCWGQSWTSPDGVAWSTTDPRTSGLDVGWYSGSLYDLEPGVAGVAAGPGGYVAYGRAVPRRSGPSSPALWRSADGLTWERVVTDALPRSTRLSAILGAPDGYLLAGVIHGRTAPRAATWSSQDGLAWTRADGVPGAFAIGAYIDTGEIALTGGPSALAWYPAPAGTIPSLETGAVAVGSACAPSTDGDIWSDGDCTAALWRSSDGTTWAKANDQLGWNPFRTATVLGDRLVVHSPSHHTCDASLLRSDDATLWSPVCGSPKPGLVALGVVGGRFVAVQRRHGAAGAQDGLVVWSSADGDAWREEAAQPVLPPGAHPYDGQVFITDADGRPLILAAVEFTEGELVHASVALLGPPLAPDEPTASPAPSPPATPS
jgi:hypothetical protein